MISIREPERFAAFEDKELALAFQAGDLGAYDALHARHAGRVQAVCRRMLHDRRDASEAVQETFLRIYRGLPTFNGRYQVAAWIARVATNVCLDHIRTRSRRPMEVLPVEELPAGSLPKNGEADPEEIYLKNTESRRVRRVLRSLSPMHRAAIVLRDFEGLSYAEVALALELSDSQTKALIHRARRAFKQKWSRPLSGLFLPASWSGKLRELDTPVRDQTASLAASANGAVASCSAALQQCGHHVAERVGGFVGAATIGAVAATTVAAASVAPVPASPFGTPSTENHQRVGSSGSNQVAEPRPAATGGAVLEVEAATPSATLSPTPTPVQSPTPAPVGPSISPHPSPTATPVEQPSGSRWSRPLVWFGSRPSSAPDASTRSQLSGNCKSGNLVQRLHAPVTHGGDVFQGLVELALRGPFELRMSLGDDELVYRARGSLSTSIEGSVATFRLQGRYATDNPEASEAWGLPESGNLSGVVEVDCEARTVLSEELRFGYDQGG